MYDFWTHGLYMEHTRKNFDTHGKNIHGPYMAWPCIKYTWNIHGTYMAKVYISSLDHTWPYCDGNTHGPYMAIIHGHIMTETHADHTWPSYMAI